MPPRMNGTGPLATEAIVALPPLPPAAGNKSNGGTSALATGLRPSPADTTASPRRQQYGATARGEAHSAAAGIVFAGVFSESSECNLVMLHSSIRRAIRRPRRNRYFTTTTTMRLTAVAAARGLQQYAFGTSPRSPIWRNPLLHILLCRISGTRAAGPARAADKARTTTTTNDTEGYRRYRIRPLPPHDAPTVPNARAGGRPVDLRVDSRCGGQDRGAHHALREAGHAVQRHARQHEAGAVDAVWC